MLIINQNGSNKLSDKLTLNYVSLDDLVSKYLFGNSKKHDIDKMKSSYLKYGFRDPVTIDKTLNKGKGGIVEGNGRIEALKALFDAKCPAPKNIEVKDGVWYVPVIFGGDADSENEAIAFSIEHNLSVLWGGEFSTEEMLKLFDSEAITQQLQELLDTEDMPITFEDNTDELLALLNLENEVEDGGFDSDKEDEIPEVEDVETRVKLGDIWQLGQHLLLCGDCTIESNIKELLGDRKVDMVFTDPPYNCTNNQWDKFSENDFLVFLENIVKIAFKYAKDTSSLYWCLNWKYIANLKLILDNYGKIINWIIWHHPSRGANFRFYTPSHQDILLYKKSDEYYFDSSQILEPYSQASIERDKYNQKQYVLDKEGKTPSDVWYFPQVRGNSHENEDHPTQKPIDLVIRSVFASSKENDIVADFFMGSGTTLIACEKTNRIAIGTEISPRYCDVILKRWENLTGKTASFLRNID